MCWQSPHFFCKAASALSCAAMYSCSGDCACAGAAANNRVYNGGVGYQGIALRHAGLAPQVYESEEEASQVASILAELVTTRFRVEPWRWPCPRGKGRRLGQA